MSNSVKRFWCVFFGFLTGTVVAKIYEIWAMLYGNYGHVYNSGKPVTFRPLSTTIRNSPRMSRLVIISIFICISILFSNCLIKKASTEESNNSTNI